MCCFVDLLSNELIHQNLILIGNQKKKSTASSTYFKITFKKHILKKKMEEQRCQFLYLYISFTLLALFLFLLGTVHSLQNYLNNYV